MVAYHGQARNRTKRAPSQNKFIVMWSEDLKQIEGFSLRTCLRPLFCLLRSGAEVNKEIMGWSG